MRSFWAIFWLEMTALVRSKTLAMLAVASVAWMFALPRLATGDGTAEGARELYVQYSLGGVFTLLVIALLASATGSLARERTAKRLALTTVRPVRYGIVVLAKGCAITLAGAIVLALAFVALPFGSALDLSRPCRHVLAPLLPSVREEAKAMYAAYMANPETPEAVRKARPERVMRILESRAADRYQTVPTNGLSRWRFDLPQGMAGLAVRMRFAGQMNARQDLAGVFRLGAFSGVVSNMTQAVLEVPLVARREGTAAEPSAAGELTFENRGRASLLLRPRRDIELLVPADSLAANLPRAYVELVSVLALTVAFGLFLSATLGRPVALFVALSMLAVGELSSGIVERSAEDLDSSVSDRIGFVLTRTVVEVMRPVTALDPISRLAKDTCVEGREAMRVVLFDLLLGPLLLAFLSGFALPRKNDVD